MTTAILALGSNLGDRLANLRAALALLGEAHVEVARTSSIWETAPMPADQPAYLNAVAVVETDLGPAQLLATLKGIEAALGRRPERHWGPRPIDLDILFFGDERVDLTQLVVPHLRIAERGFVLAPLAEAWAGPLPVLGLRALDLLAQVDTSGLARRGEAL